MVQHSSLSSSLNESSSFTSTFDDADSETQNKDFEETQNMDDEGEGMNEEYHVDMEKETTYNVRNEDDGEGIENGCGQRNYNESVQHDESVEEPKLGMTFDTIEEVANFYADYGKKLGFGVFKRSSEKDPIDDTIKYATFACNRAQKSVSKSKNSLNPRPTTKTDCGAKIRVVLGADKKYHVSKVYLEHNHSFSPSKGRFYRCYRKINRHVKRQLEIHQRAGVRMNKSFNTLVVENGGYENLPFTEKDCRNYINKVKRLKFGEGDAEAIQGYFMKVQSIDREFFYAWELDEENRLKNLFWADSRCRASYEEFGDVVTFDTTYLTNEYEMPMAPFVGVNHHGQSILLGCALISNEDVRTFTWLFQTWLSCMSGRAPNAIITDQDQAMKKAIEIVFPDSRHRWCLWHIMNKIPKKFGKHAKYKSIKYRLKKAVYDCLTTVEFEVAWKTMIDRYKLEKNRWLKVLYEEKKDGSLALKTTLKQFVEQYENALRDRAEKENLEDFNSYNSCYPPITRYAMEKQMKDILTNAKFKEFRVELTGKMYCGIGFIKSHDGYIEYEVIEDVIDNENLMKKHFSVWFKKGDSVEECDIRCICRLFEFRGMLCRHVLTVLTTENVYLIPSKYILQRWRKDIKRRHTKVKVNYSDWVVSDVGRRYDKMCHAFSEVADLASDLDEKCSLVLDRVNELKSEILGEKTNNGSTMCTQRNNDFNNENVKIRDPPAVRRKGRPPSKRLQSTSEKIVKNITKKKKTLDEVRGRAVDNETVKEGDQNDYYLPTATNSNGYTNFPFQYGGFISSGFVPSAMQQYSSQYSHVFQQVPPPMQHVDVQMQQSSHINSLNASYNMPFGPPNNALYPP
ncbi:protein FAR1-RELATED SEQUENCE 4-like [Rutidosis leptorrhynchoides]|uniref:protein FAR1-RELATED SEQUENCE 4-like n=1 Tax=Rutidosis leptorrhynchoides TaxID=125765 RepID=UPI003A9923CE